MERGDRPNRIGKRGVLLSAVCLLTATPGGASSFLSYTGALGSPESVFEATFVLATTDTINIQTWSFGGGTNAAGQLIAAGGFDPLVALFSGPPATATMYTDGLGNPLADADNLGNPPYSPVGNCPPAGFVTIGTGSGSAICGDDFLQISGLPAGLYTLVLTDANYLPNAIFDNGALSEGFTDLTGGLFQTCNTTSDGTTCVDDNPNFAVDIVSATGTMDLGSAPEPGALAPVSIGLAALACLKQFRKRRTAPHTKGTTI
ncbi:MAG: DVUA0089 family protein [Bryobacteraceae bacterium]